MTWKKIEPELTEAWNFENSATLEGEYFAKKESVGRKKSSLYFVKIGNGQETCFWGSALLDSRMKEIPFGARIMVKFLGTETSEKTKRTYKIYEVWTDD